MYRTIYFSSDFQGIAFFKILQLEENKVEAKFFYDYICFLSSELISFSITKTKQNTLQYIQKD